MCDAIGKSCPLKVEVEISCTALYTVHYTAVIYNTVHNGTFVQVQVPNVVPVLRIEYLLQYNVVQYCTSVFRHDDRRLSFLYYILLKCCGKTILLFGCK